MLDQFLQLFAFRSFVGNPEPVSKRTQFRGRGDASGAYGNTRTWLVIGWAAIAAKCAAMWWLIAKYHVPIHPLWLVLPTVLFGLLATAIYIWRS